VGFRRTAIVPGAAPPSSYVSLLGVAALAVFTTSSSPLLSSTTTRQPELQPQLLLLRTLSFALFGLVGASARPDTIAPRRNVYVACPLPPRYHIFSGTPFVTCTLHTDPAPSLTAANYFSTQITQDCDVSEANAASTMLSVAACVESRAIPFENLLGPNHVYSCGIVLKYDGVSPVMFDFPGKAPLPKEGFIACSTAPRSGAAHAVEAPPGSASVPGAERADIEGVPGLARAVLSVDSVMVGPDGGASSRRVVPAAAAAESTLPLESVDGYASSQLEPEFDADADADADAVAEGAPLPPSPLPAKCESHLCLPIAALERHGETPDAQLFFVKNAATTLSGLLSSNTYTAVFSKEDAAAAEVLSHAMNTTLLEQELAPPPPLVPTLRAAVALASVLAFTTNEHLAVLIGGLYCSVSVSSSLRRNSSAFAELAVVIAISNSSNIFELHAARTHPVSASAEWAAGLVGCNSLPSYVSALDTPVGQRGKKRAAPDAPAPGSGDPT
jgi:hypothetical protein